MIRIVAVLLSAVSVLQLSACSQRSVSHQNHAPLVDAIVISTTSPIGIAQSITLTCRARDTDGDALSYSWSSDSGTFLSDSYSAEVTWQAPPTPCLCQLVVEVSDGTDVTEDSVVVPVRSVPVPRFTIVPESGTTTTVFTFDASDSEDLQTPRDQLKVRWLFDSVWTPWSSGKVITHKFDRSGSQPVILQVRNNDDFIASKDSTVLVESIPFTIENLGVKFEDFDPKTNYAGDFYFSHSLYKVFWEFGARVKDTAGNIKELGEFSYMVRKDAPVTAIAEGVVIAVNYQQETSDFEFTIRSLNDTAYDVIYDHLINVRVSVGEHVSPGDTLATPHVWPDWEVGHFEITIANRFTQLFYCPFCCFSAERLQEYQNKVAQLISDWEEFTGDDDLYDQENWIGPGCRYETLPSY